MPDEKSFAIQHIVAPFADVPILVGPTVLSLAILRGILIEALVLAAVIPLLLTKAMLLVLVPVPNILGAVGVSIDAESLSHVIHEFSLVEIS
jgi:hypothetical protein